MHSYTLKKGKKYVRYSVELRCTLYHYADMLLPNSVKYSEKLRCTIFHNADMLLPVLIYDFVLT